MTKEVLKSDVGKIKDLIEKVIGDKGELSIERMGGLTNHSYKVTLKNGENYAVRLPGDGTEDMINRSDEKISTNLACDLGIDARLLYFGPDGSKVTDFIKNAVTMNAESMKNESNIKQAADIFKTLHNSNVNTKVPFEVFDMAKSYEDIINKNNVYTFDDYNEIKNDVMKIKKEIDESCFPVKVPCHNDPLCENWVMGSDKMYLIDWEYAGMNDGLWDLADVSLEAGYNDSQDMLFLKCYLRKDNIDSLTKKHFFANKIYVDYLWTLWAKTRVPFDGQPMEDWATERYTRLKKNINEFKNL